MQSTSYADILKAEEADRARRRHPLRLVLIFLAVFFALQYAWGLSRGTWLEHVVIDQATVIPASWIINQIWPVFHVIPEGHRLIAPMGRLNVLNGCEGLEILFLLVAALIAHPFAWRSRSLGIGLGALLVFVLNQARIVILWHAYLSNRDWFSALHGTVLPLIMIACCFIFFLAFLSRHDTPHE